MDSTRVAQPRIGKTFLAVASAEAVGTGVIDLDSELEYHAQDECTVVMIHDGSTSQVEHLWEHFGPELLEDHDEYAHNPVHRMPLDQAIARFMVRKRARRQRH